MSGADLTEVNFTKANLTKAELWKTILIRTIFYRAELIGTDFTEADLHGAAIDEFTRFSNIIGCQVGVNGFRCKETESAALMTIFPTGDSMQGSNPDAVIESLKRARRLHGTSLTFAGVVLLIFLLGITEPIELSNPKVNIPPNRFGLLTIFISIGILSLVNTFMKDALVGIRYLTDRKSVMAVGNFPWVLGKFAGNTIIDKIESFVIRFILAFHPLVYLCNWGKWEDLTVYGFTTSMIVLFIFSAWTFIISQRFQKPILFDKKTEEKNIGSLEKLVKVVEGQTLAIKMLVDSFKLQKHNTTNINKVGSAKGNKSQ